MKPEQKSELLLDVARSKAKMLEYGVPKEHHIKISQDPAELFIISIGLLGDFAAAINRKEQDPASPLISKTNLLFSARFFDSYLQSKMNEMLDPYLLLLGSASYYLCDLPGSSAVLAKCIDGACPNLDGDGLENLLLWLLQADLKTYFKDVKGPFGEFIDKISYGICRFFSIGEGEKNLLDLATNLRATVYEFGTPRQLLFGDVIAAILRKKLENSVWKTLPLYSELPCDNWLGAMQKDSFIKELWPAQHLLGQADVLKGKSAIVQMPTSAGKTKATELILRSAFLAKRISLAIIIAPFRALSHEIKSDLIEAFAHEGIKVDELSDALQTDFMIGEFLKQKQILIITPEKLLYVLRHAPKLAAHIGLLIFDEGHQFDNGIRGVTYELLLTSLLSMIPVGTQKILISAVIPNAEDIGEWLNGERLVVKGTTLLPTLRSIGFVSWRDKIGRIEYVNSSDILKKEFFVPRVIEPFKLKQKDHFFPENNTDVHNIALYLGLKLVPNGSVAIFCGRKATAALIGKKAVKIIQQDLPMPLPLSFSDTQEIERLKYLHDVNLGPNAPASQSAAHGIFFHHGNTPHGIRLAVEHALRDNLVRFVICTSTLAQGVNLPIRYLIVNNVYQTKECIKTPDFHNLIGRVGRAGMHTEGSILFANPIIFDERMDQKERWRWIQVFTLLHPATSESCNSNLLSIFDDIKVNTYIKGQRPFTFRFTTDALAFANIYINNPDDLNKIIVEKIFKQKESKFFSRDEIEKQIAWKISLISAIESFLLSHWDESENGLSEIDVAHLAEKTLAFFLADDQKKKQICELFQLLARNISTKITDPVRRKSYGRTLYGIHDARAIEEWVQTNATHLLSIVDKTSALDIIWPLLTQHIKNDVFIKFDKPEIRKEIAHGWISGMPFGDLLEIIHEKKAKIIWGTKRKNFNIDDVVNICENTFAFNGGLVVAAVCEFIDQDSAKELLNLLQLFQKCLKYGLPTETTIALYELGFSDRVIAQDLTSSLNLVETKKKSLVEILKKDQRAQEVMKKYPVYFQKKMSELINDG